MRLLSFSLMLGILVLAAAPPAVAQSPDNEAMAQRVADTLKESGRLKNYRVGVKFQDGVAWLLGSVASEEQRQTAEAVARETAGVSQVVNRLEIAGEQPRTAAQPQIIELPQISPQSQRQEVTLATGPLSETYPAATQLTSAYGMPEPPLAAPQLGPPPRPIPMPMPQQAAPARAQAASYPMAGAAGMTGGPVPMGYGPQGMARQVSHDHAAMPGYAWPSYAAYPNYAALTYPQQYSPAAWPYIGPFYPYPQVPLGWRKVTLEWDDGWWFLDFKE